MAKDTMFCIFCNKTVVGGLGQLARHIQHHTQEKPHFCEKCPADFPTETNLREHHTLHPNCTKDFEPITCEICEIDFAGTKRLVRHFAVYHKGKSPYICKICNTNHYTKARLRAHQEYHTETRDFVCPHCGLAFQGNLGLTRHIRQLHSSEKYPCSLCPAKFKCKRYLLSHLRIHTGEKPFHCKVCDRRFSQRQTLKNHRCSNLPQTHKTLPISRKHKPHRQKPTYKKPIETQLKVKCSVCPKEYLSENALYQHMRIHTGERPYHCRICKKAFPSSSSRNLHEQHHEGKSICKVCGKEFNMRASLRSHMKLHDEQEKTTCVICSKKVVSTYVLENHMQKHTREKPDMCNICGLELPRARTLRIHLTEDHPTLSELLHVKTTRVIPKHISNLNWNCSVCGKICTTKHHLSIHRAVQCGRGPKVFTCSVCNQTFQTHRAKFQHQLSHEEKQFCNICGKSYDRLQYLKRHMKMHNVESLPTCVFCNQRLATLRLLEKHIRCHTLEKIISCKTCGKGFAKMETLMQHQGRDANCRGIVRLG